MSSGSCWEKMGGAIDDAEAALKRLWRLHELEFGADGEYVRDGGFTDAGRKRLMQLFEEGKRNSEIAVFFGVSDAAIAYHRKRSAQKAKVTA
jgi:DNA-binding NarL/FixJ family response regulator